MVFSLLLFCYWPWLSLLLSSSSSLSIPTYFPFWLSFLSLLSFLGFLSFYLSLCKISLILWMSVPLSAFLSFSLNSAARSSPPRCCFAPLEPRKTGPMQHPSHSFPTTAKPYRISLSLFRFLTFKTIAINRESSQFSKGNTYVPLKYGLL